MEEKAAAEQAAKAAESDRWLREQEREMERLEDENQRRRQKGGTRESESDPLDKVMDELKLFDRGL